MDTIDITSALPHYFEFWKELGRQCARTNMLTPESAATDYAGDLLEELGNDLSCMGQANTLFPDVATAMFKAVDWHCCVEGAAPTNEFKAFKAGFEEINIELALGVR